MTTRKARPKGPAAPRDGAATSGDVAKATRASVGGRPRNARSAKLGRQDELITDAVTRLWAWGETMRDACKAVAAAAVSVWGRDLGADAVEKIFERCSDAYGSSRPPRLGRYALKWRREGMPADAREMVPVHIATTLLRHGGRWPGVAPGDWPAPRGDAELTASAHADYLRNRIKLKTG